MTQPVTKKLMILTCLFVAGCSEQLDSTHTAVVRDRPGPSFFVHEVLLKDGTRCVISTSGLPDGGTGITCDWASLGEIE